MHPHGRPDHTCTHWTDAPEQRAAGKARVEAERARVAAAEAAGFTGGGARLVLVLQRPSDIPGCADYETVATIPAGFTLRTSWRERGNAGLVETRLYWTGETS